MRKIQKKYIVLGISLLLCLAIGVTVALSNDISNTLINSFFVGSIDSEIVEDKPIVSGDIINKKPQIKNTGGSPALVRVRITVSPEKLWKPNGEQNTLTLDINDTYWEYNSIDGYYYYKGVLNPYENNDDLISVFTKVKGATTQDGKLIEAIDKFEIAIYQETIATTATNKETNKEINAIVNGEYDHDNAMEIWRIYDTLTLED